MPNSSTRSPEQSIHSPKIGRSRQTSVIIEEGPHNNDSSAPVRPRPRPKLSSRATSFAHSAKRASMGARSYSSMSLYAHFAGEHLADEDAAEAYQKKRVIAEEKEDSGIDTEQIKVVPTASVGKAMFMFLKAFIGSGVLFLPKA